MPVYIVKGDITQMATDAIVNAANPYLLQGGGVCGAIFEAAGADELARACKAAATGGCEVGGAVITPGFALTARYIIHTPGPVWRGGKHGEEAQLHSCYISSLELACSHGCSSVAFPLISSGIYGYPKDEALRVALEAIAEFLSCNEMDVYMVLLQRDALYLRDGLYDDLREYIGGGLNKLCAPRMAAFSVSADECAAPAPQRARRERKAKTMSDAATAPSAAATAPSDAATAPSAAATAPSAAATAPSDGAELERLLSERAKGFSQYLMELIDRSGMTDSQVYRRANIDRRLFSKIRCDRDYRPAKNTVLSLAIALELCLDDALDLLARAGYALSPSNEGDLIVRYFIEHGNFDIYEINSALFAFTETTLTA